MTGPASQQRELAGMITQARPDAPWLALAPVAAVAFTAGRELDHAGAQLVMATCDRIAPPADRYVTGGARGGDALIGHYLAVTRRWAEHVVVLPANRSQVDPWWDGGAQAFRVRAVRLGELSPWPSGAELSPEMFKPRVTLIEMPDGTDYADRNAELVKLGAILHGFPAYTEDDKRSRRSGSWQTIRMARRAGKMGEWHCTALPGRWGRG